MFHFLHPEVLWALTALVLPIIIHLFNFKRYQKIFFSNLKFLSSLNIENKKRSQLKKWILLLLRLLALASIVIAFAQPYKGKENRLKNLQSESFCIYIDNSFSMNAETEKGIALDVAKNKAFDLLKSFPKNSRIRIYSNNRELSSPVLNKEQAIAKIQEIIPSPFISKLSNKLKTIAIDTKKEAVRIYFFSDFQKNQSDFKNLDLDSSAIISLLPLAMQKTTNLIVDSCWFEKPFHELNQAEELHVNILNLSNTDFSKIPLKLSINDKTKTQISFDIKKNSNKILKLKYYNRELGIYNGKVELDDYPISYDNSLFFSYFINRKNNILCINQDSSNKYINNLYAASNNFTLTNKNKVNIFNENTALYQLIIVNEIDKMESGFRHLLASYVENGGHLLFFPSKKINQSVNQFLSDIKAPSLLEIDTNTQKLAQIELKSKIYQNVFEKLDDKARLPNIFKHYKIDNSNNRFQEKLLQTKGNSAILTKTSYGNGLLYLFTTQLNPKWTNLVSHPLIIPSMLNLSRNTSNSTPLYHQIASQKAIKIKRNKKYQGQYHVVNKKLKIDFIPEQSDHFEKDVSIFPSKQIKTAENYLISLNDSIIKSCSYNYSRLESILEYFTENEVREQIKAHHTISVNNPFKAKQAEFYKENHNRKRYWKIFVLLCLLFLLLEVLAIKLN